MSTTLAIATITTALAALLRKAREPLPGDPADDTTLSDLDVTSLALEKARTTTANQLNLFLYNVSWSPSLRNVAMPSAGAGTLASAPLALDLHYLVTAYGKDDVEENGHRALGRAMTILHRHAALFPSELEDALAEGGVHEQRERVRIVPAPMSIEEMSKLWTTFQTNYRLSVAYQVSVVLIESGARPRSAAPVLRPVVGASASLRSTPSVDRIVYASGRSAATLGSTVTLEGTSLAAPSLGVRVTHPRAATPLALTLVAAVDGRSATFTLPTAASVPTWPSGACVLELIDAGGARSAPRPFAIAPTITLDPVTLVGGPGTTPTLDVMVSPDVRPAQRVELLFGARVVPGTSPVAPTNAMTFTIASPDVGVHQVRLRVDGVESALEVVVDPVSGLPVYGDAHEVEVTP